MTGKSRKTLLRRWHFSCELPIQVAMGREAVSEEGHLAAVRYGKFGEQMLWAVSGLAGTCRSRSIEN